jgi:excinuclease ABC subunit C
MPETYAGAVRDAQLLLEGRSAELERALTARMMAAAEAEQFEAAARLRDQLSTVHQLQEKQRIATAEQGDDADVFGYHFEAGSLAVNLFHVRAGKIVDRREFFWEDLPDLLEAAEPEPSSPSAESSSSAEELLSTEESLSPFKAASYQGTTSVVPQTQQDESRALALAPEGNANPPEDLRAPSIPRSSAEWVGDYEPQPASQNPATLTEPEAPFHAGPVFSALLKQLYIDQHYVPRAILVPADFDDRETLAALLSERTGHRIEIAVPQRGEKRSLVDLAGQNAKQSYIQRFRVLEPSRKAIQEALADALLLPELPRRIECFDISHIQGAETVASMVVWQDGKMNKQAYRKFKVKTVEGVDDFASMREVVARRYRRLLESQDTKENDTAASLTSIKIGSPVSGLELNGDGGPVSGHDFSRAEDAPNKSRALAPEGRSSSAKEPKTLPSLILVDGGLGQLHAAAEALESLGLTTQPLASIAKREEIIYLYGSEDEPVVLDRRSPVLHLIQLIRDESHRFAVGYHRQRRAMRDRDSELLNIPGVGPQTRQRLLTHFGSLRDIQQATAESLAAVVPSKTAETIWRHFHLSQQEI